MCVEKLLEILKKLKMKKNKIVDRRQSWVEVYNYVNKYNSTATV